MKILIFAKRESLKHYSVYWNIDHFLELTKQIMEINPFFVRGKADRYYKNGLLGTIKFDNPSDAVMFKLSMEEVFLEKLIIRKRNRRDKKK